MDWKKSWIGVFLWAVCLLWGSTALYLFGYEIGKEWLYLTDEYSVLAGGISVAVVLIVFTGVGLICRKIGLLREKNNEENQNLQEDGTEQNADTKGKSRKWIPEVCLILGMAALGIAARIWFLPGSMEDISYYSVTGSNMGNAVPQIVHGGTYFYLLLLRGLFFLAGSQWIYGIWLQLALSIFAALIWYFAVRKSLGIFPAVMAMGYLLLFPGWIDASTCYGPQILYLFLFGVSLLMNNVGLKRMTMSHKSVAGDLILSLINGLFIGVLTYMDLFGVILLLCICSGIWIQSAKRGLGRKAVVSALGLFAAAGSFVACLFVDALLCGKHIWSIAEAYLELYRPDGILSWDSNSFVVIWMLLLLLACCTYWFTGKGRDVILPWMGMMAVCGCFVTFGLFFDQMNMELWVGIFAVAMAAAGIRGCVTAKKKVKAETEAEESADGLIAEHADVRLDRSIGGPTGRTVDRPAEGFTEVKVQAEQKAAEQNVPEQKVESPKPVFFQTPLPMPKRHVKKVADFGIEVSEEQMKYDLEIDEKDDYDIR